MALEPSFVEWVEETLGSVTPVRVKKMFGGLGIYSGDLFFAIADGKAIYLKVDETNRADFEQHGMNAFVPDETEPTKTMNYYPVPPAILEQSAELAVWVEKALGVAERAKRPRRGKG